MFSVGFKWERLNKYDDGEPKCITGPSTIIPASRKST